jgi:hypothetical protein
VQLEVRSDAPHIQNPGTPQEFDRDVTQNDALGDAVLWLTSSPALVA